MEATAVDDAIALLEKANAARARVAEPPRAPEETAAYARAQRPELVVLVSHEVTRRGWKDVREGELCKIPGVGPVSPRSPRTSPPTPS